MKIGLNYKAYSTIFGSGKGQTILAIAAVCRAAGHEVVLLQETERVWWDDVAGLEANYTILQLTREYHCDLLIDVDGLLDPDLRSAVGDKVVVFLRSDPSFEYLEKAAYMNQEAPYSLQGVHEVWVWDEMVPVDREPLLNVMLERPIRRLPYVWIPDLLKQYQKNEGFQPKALEPRSSWVAVISEKNTTTTSSCLVPLLGAVKAKNITDILLTNATQLKDNAFFQENLVKNGLVFKSPELHYEGRMRYADLVGTDSLLVSHLRHAPFRPGLLDIVWLGLPLVHNCKLLESMGTYYSENDVAGLTQAIETFSIGGAAGYQQIIEERWSVSKGRAGWAAHLEPKTKSIRVTFTDMWEGFDPLDNLFLDLMRSSSTMPIEGTTEPGDLLICGPFGPVWQEERFRKQRKVYYSGEPPFEGECLDSRIDLFLTHNPVETDRHMRMPVWTLFIDWFGPGTSRRNNPNQLPIHYMLLPYDGPRSEFCAFVVSNPLCEARNAAFETVNAYKKVNSGGTYKNNIGGPLPATYSGGGGGDLAKFEFLKKHRFSICYENCVASGYVTEKLLHAKMAGTIPLYWGSPEAVKDFDSNGFLHIQDGQDIVQIIKDLEGDPQKMLAIASRPALNQEQFLTMRAQLETIGRKLVQLATTKAIKNEVIMPIVGSTLFVSFATKAYLPSLSIAIQSVATLRKTDSTLQMRVYLGSDVESTGDLSERFPWVAWKRLPAPPSSFPDQFEPKMFGWKLWLLHDLCHEEESKGDSILYADAGAAWISSPRDMLSVISQTGVCLVKDRTQMNYHWCSDSMIKAMAVTPEELEQNQLMASVIGFQAGHPAACRLLDEALQWGSKKEVLFGPYCLGIGPDGHPFGHRHDQSILSVLASRQACSQIEGSRTICEASLRKAYQKATPVYLHRSKFTHHTPVIPGIDDIWVISLDRRPDRWQSLLEAHPTLASIANRMPGIDGRLLELTSDLANLFARNDFKWKKSVTGCALSHVLTWAQLASEHPSLQNYLILEDDCRFTDSAWQQQLAIAVANAPPDADLLMLGGVLPVNLDTYPTVLEPINDFWAVIRPNTIFSPKEMIPFFHFCAYSYILTRAGAAKLIAAIHTQGIYTSIDHFLMHPSQGLTTYVLKDLITTCFQADNPAYKAAAFDEFLRVDTYDSDIWNNNECFANPPVTGGPLTLWASLMDVLQQAPHSIQTRNTLRQEAVLQPSPSTLYYCPNQGKPPHLLEMSWLTSLWPSLECLPCPSITAIRPNSWLLVGKPAIPFWQSVCQSLDAKGIPFRILHLSDEGCSDPIEFYSFKSCKKVIRNYVRSGLDEQVLVLPLGPAILPAPSILPSFSERPFVWGFHGTNWFHRKIHLTPLLESRPHMCHWIPEFQHATMTQPKEYQQMLLKSQFIPVPRGNNTETFRLYEALEHGAIPLYVRTEGDEIYWAWLKRRLTLLEIRSWNEVPRVLELFRKSPEKAEQYRAGLLDQWTLWKTECKTYFP